MWKLLVLAGMLSWATSVRSAEIPFLDPFATPQQLALQRSTPDTATHQLKFRRTTTISGDADQVAEIIIDVAKDWAALYVDGSRTRLHDHRLLSVFDIDTAAGTFTVSNKLGHLAFLAAEIANRKFMAGLIDAAGAGGTTDDACDAEAELSSRLREGDAFRGDVSIDRQPTAVTATCNGRPIGIIHLGEGEAVPATLWPTLLTEFPLHPALAAELKAVAAPPRRLEVFYDLLGKAVTVTLSLEASGTAATPYPLTTDLKNASTARLAATTSSELAVVAEATVAGTADGGAPTSAAWEQRLRAMAQQDNGSRAILALLPTAAMFPELVEACSPGNNTVTCVLAANAAAFAEIEPAIRAALSIAVAEQSGDPRTALAAMKAAQPSAIADDPVLGQAFALALLRFGPEFQRAAAADGLPADPLPLMLRTIQAYPYNPWYWADLSDLYVARWDYETAMTLLAVARSVDIPAAGSPALLSKGPGVRAIREAYPAFFLPD
jgi:hypothetical protein